MENSQKLKSMIPLNEVESSALDQVQKILNLSEVEKIVLCPDVHTGYDAPIGSVILTKGIIRPSFVGYDIGCGMVNYDTQLPMEYFFKNSNKAEKLFEKLKSVLKTGTGVEWPIGTQQYDEFISASGDKELSKRINVKISTQLSTVGSGNHFVELGNNLNSDLSITIHSGSRRPGWEIAAWYMGKAKEYNHSLPLNSELGQAYVHDMLFMQDFALENRIQILLQILEVLGIKCDNNNLINENHNMADILSDGYVLHRKGATPAKKDQLGVIPGSRKSGVYITKGLGNEEYLSSASHGAGRKMSRKAAKEKIDLEFEKKNMKGIICDVTEKNLDEADGAYKDLSKVIGYQEGLVIEVVDFIKPLINVK